MSLTEATAKDLTEIYQNNQPSHLTLLTNLINDQDPDLNAKIIPVIAQALLLVFENLQQIDCNEHQEAATKLFRAICMKMSNQQQSFDDADQVRLAELPTELTSYEDVFTKYPIVWEYIAKNAGTSKSLDIKILDFLAHFQYRGNTEPNNDRYLEISEKISAMNWENARIDGLLRRFNAHLEQIQDLPKKIEFLFSCIDENDGCIYEIKYRLKRFAANGLYIYDTDVKFYTKLRKYLADCYSNCPNLLHLVEFRQAIDVFVFIGFTKNDSIVADLLEIAEADPSMADKLKYCVEFLLPEKVMVDEPMAGVVLHELNLNYVFRFKT
jgi:hypothetical protein